MKLWLDATFALALTITTSAASTVNTRRRKLERFLDRMRRARDQLLTFAAFPERVDAHITACERDLRPAVIQRKNTNGYRAMWSAKGDAAAHTVVAIARVAHQAGTFSTVLGTISV